MNAGANVVTFGEALLRLAPPDHLRLRQTASLELVFGGAEANVAVSLANFGLPVQYVTRLPDNELGSACVNALRQHGVATDHVIYGGARLGLYFLEVGRGNRPSQVIYDRAFSSFATLETSAIPWPRCFAGARWFHWSGISPAVSANAARVTADAVTAARDAGVVVSCDLNYRHTLWQWGAAPAAVMSPLIARCDVLLANSAHLMLEVPDLPSGETPEAARDALLRLADAYPHLQQIAMTCREVIGSGAPRYTAVMWQAGALYTSPTFTLTNIVDRIGAGDAFMAGLIYGLTTYPAAPQRVINFAAAAAAFKHTVKGDANLASVREIEALLDPRDRFDVVR